MGIANGADIDAEQLELGRHIRAHKWLAVFTAELRGDRAGHLIARSDQTEDTAVPGRAFTDGVDVRIAADALAVDGHPTTWTKFQTRLFGQGVLRTDTGGKHNQIGLEEVLADEVHPVAVFTAGADRLGTTGQVHTDPQRLDLILERLT